MKTAKSSKKTKLSKKQVKVGIFLNEIQRVEEVAYRKLNLDSIKRVGYTRKALYVTANGKRLAVVLPIFEGKQ